MLSLWGGRLEPIFKRKKDTEWNIKVENEVVLVGSKESPPQGVGNLITGAQGPLRWCLVR